VPRPALFDAFDAVGADDAVRRQQGLWAGVARERADAALRLQVGCTGSTVHLSMPHATIDELPA
jgi:hypothetical protein